MELVGGDQVYLSSDEASALYLVEGGTVEVVHANSELPLATIGPNQSFGDYPFVSGERRIGTAHAREYTRLLRIKYDKLEKLLDQRPTLAHLFYRNAAEFYARFAGRLAAELKQPYF